MARRLGYAAIVCTAWVALAAPAAAEVVIDIRSPEAGQVLAWGREAPRLEIHAALLVDGRPAVAPRLYLTAKLLNEAGELVERVSLFDDGSAEHRDASAQDGLYSGVHVPPRPGRFKVAVQVEWPEGQRQGLLRGKLESPPVELVVAKAPCPVIVSPKPSGRLPQHADVSVRLVEDGVVYQTKADEQARVEVTIRSGDDAPQSVAAVLRGKDWTAPVRFPRRGRATVEATLTILRGGRPVTLTAEPVSVEVARAPWGWVVAGVLLLLSSWLVRGNLNIFDHELRLYRPGATEPVTVALTGSRGRSPVVRRVGAPGEPCDVSVEGWPSGKVLVLSTLPGQPVVSVRTEPESMLEVSGGQRGRQVELPHSKELAVDGWRVKHEKFQSAGSSVRTCGVWFWLFCVVGASALAVGIVQVNRFWNG